MNKLDKELRWLEWKCWFWPFRIYNNIRDGLANLWYWLPIIWNDRCWDQNFLLNIWEHKFRAMAYYFEHHGMVVDHKKQAEQSRICAELCWRIAEHDYVSDEDYRFILEERGHVSDEKFSKKIKKIFEKEEELQKQDIEMLTGMIQKHLLTWWD